MMKNKTVCHLMVCTAVAIVVIAGTIMRNQSHEVFGCSGSFTK